MFTFRKKHLNPSLILMYHRINHAVSDTWQLCVSPENFAEQMQILKHYQVVPMKVLVEGLQKNSVPPGSIALSFDDGYFDNYKYAKPLLEKYQYPATFFLTNLARERDREFWWDALEWLLLENKHLPECLTLDLPHQSMKWNLRDDLSHLMEDQLKPFASWLPWKTPPSAPHALFIILSELIKGLPFREQEMAMEQLYAGCCQKLTVRQEFKKMEERAINHLAHCKQFEIGGHSACHTALGHFSGSIQYDAVLENKKYLEAITGTAPEGYAYAHGSYNDESIRILKELGYQYACSTKDAAVMANANKYALPRYQVKDWSGVEFKNRIDRWFNNL